MQAWSYSGKNHRYPWPSWFFSLGGFQGNNSPRAVTSYDNVFCWTLMSWRPCNVLRGICPFSVRQEQHVMVIQLSSHNAFLSCHASKAEKHCLEKHLSRIPLLYCCSHTLALLHSHHGIQVTPSLQTSLSAPPKPVLQQKDGKTAAHDALLASPPSFITGLLVNRQHTRNIPLFVEMVALGVTCSNFWRLLRV